MKSTLVNTDALRIRALDARSRLRGMAYAILLVAAAALIARALHGSFGLTRLSPLFLAPVLLSGVWLGVRPAILAAFLSFSIFNFFLVEPRFELRLADVEDALTLAIFLGVALLTGGLAGRLRDQTERAQMQAQALNTLFQASRTMSLSDSESAILEQVRLGIARISGGPAAIWRPGAVRTDDLGALPAEIAHRVRALAELGEIPTALAGDWQVRGLAVDEVVVAMAAWRVAHPGADVHQDEAIDLLVDLGAATIARVRLSAAGAEAQAMARMERLRTALLSSLSHDFRTPLSAILASASSLAEYGDHFTAETRRDLASNIQEEAEALSSFVSNLLSMTRLESGALVIAPARVRAAEIAHEVAERLERRRPNTEGEQRRIVVTECDMDEPQALADPRLMAQALTNVLDNALTYSPPDRPIEVAIRRAPGVPGSIVIAVHDEGPGVEGEDHIRIFDKFYRAGPNRVGAAGSGLGLSIAKGLIEAMNGAIEAAPGPGGQGLTVAISLPEASDAAP